MISIPKPKARSAAEPTVASYRRTASIGALLALLAGGALACDRDDWGPDQLGRGKTDADRRRLVRGRDVYATYCAGCHGENGDGQGPASRFLDPKPRDFRRGRLKFAAVEAGQPPRTEDYLRIISGGLKGTAMPSFRLLPSEDLSSVVAYVRTFYDWSDDPPGGAVAVAADPWVGEADKAIAEGEKAYHGLAKCWSCHPAYVTRKKILEYHEQDSLPTPDFRPDLYESSIKDSDWGMPIRAPDFLVDRVKTGIEIDSLVRVVAAGVGGTAMPTWGGSLEPEALWGLAYYIRSTALRRGTAEGAALKVTLAATSTATPAPTAPAAP